MKRSILAMVFGVVLVSSNAFAQQAQAPVKPAVAASAITPETKELVRRLLEANGVRDSLLRIFEDIISRAPADQQKELRDVLKTDEIIDNIIPVYAKYYTADEIKEMIAFYKSPIGVKNLGLTPQLMTEVMQVSGKYFEDHVKKLEKTASTPGSPAKAVKTP